MAKNEKASTINVDRIPSFTDFVALPLKAAGCWEWFPKTDKTVLTIINNAYVGFVLLNLMNMIATFLMSVYIDWENGGTENLNIIAETIPYVASFLVICYFKMHQAELYDLVEFINTNLRFYSARGLTNATMLKSYKTAKLFQYVYLISVCWSVTMYTVGPVVVHCEYSLIYVIL